MFKSDVYCSRQELPIKFLASVKGKIAPLQPSHALVARVSARPGYEGVAWHTDQVGWKGSTPVTKEIFDKFSLMKNNLHSANGSLTRTALTVVRLETYLEKHSPVKSLKVCPQSSKNRNCHSFGSVTGKKPMHTICQKMSG